MYFPVSLALLKTYIETLIISPLSLPIRFWNQRASRGIEKQRAREFSYNGGKGERQFVHVGTFNGWQEARPAGAYFRFL